MKVRKIAAIQEEYCTGCSACANICPVGAIHIQEDTNGSYKANVDLNSCIDCGLCDNVCPILKPVKNTAPVNTLYAAWADEKTRLASSSGGTFTVFANQILDHGGVVIGASWGKNFQVVHKAIDAKKDLFLLQKSKYLQSFPGDIYKVIAASLAEGKPVLFVGTPCQIAAARNFIKTKAIDDSNLILVDFYCHNAPPYKVFQGFIDTNFGKNLRAFSFRTKKNNLYVCHFFSYRTEGDVTSKTVTTMTPFFEGYFPGLFKPHHCEHCTFQPQNMRLGDISIGDFWKIEEHDPSWNDGKGTSMILVNTKKGEHFFTKTKRAFTRLEETPLDWIRSGQGACTPAHPCRDFFYNLLNAKIHFNKAVSLALKGKLFDIGLACVLVYNNYGSALTNYALYRTLKSYGKEVLIINQPLSSAIKPTNNTQYFKENPFHPEDCAGYFRDIKEMSILNSTCKKFLVGSDQLFNERIYSSISGFTKLTWVDDAHRKIAYSTSFGMNRIFGTPEERYSFRKAIRRFDYISLREAWGLPLVQEKFGVHAEFTLDPVFLCPMAYWEELIGKVELKAKKHAFFYILDPSQEKGEFVKRCIDILGNNHIVTSDRARNAANVKEHWDINTFFPSCNEEWLALLAKSSFVIADSFHALAFAIIFNRPFLVLKNSLRGNDRATSLLEILGQKDRLVDETIQKKDLGSIIRKSIDWESINSKIESLKESSRKWFENHIINDIDSL